MHYVATIILALAITSGHHVGSVYTCAVVPGRRTTVLHNGQHTSLTCDIIGKQTRCVSDPTVTLVLQNNTLEVQDNTGQGSHAIEMYTQPIQGVWCTRVQPIQQ